MDRTANSGSQGYRFGSVTVL